MTGTLRSPLRLRRIGMVAGAVAAVGLAIPAVAKSAVTIGEDTSAVVPAILFGCPPDPPTCTYVQSAHPTRSFAAPVDGVIVRWRVRGASGTDQVSLRALTRNGDGTFTGAGTSEPQTLVEGVENIFDTRLAVKQGQFIGLDVPRDAAIRGRPLSATTQSIWNPRLADGETREPLNSPGYALLYNADIEPDCDQDGFGDETQDPSLFGGSCPPKDRTLSLETSKARVKKGKKVRLYGQLDAADNEAGCEAGQPVELQRKKPHQDDFAPFEQVQTEAQGAYSTKERVRKTYDYRAQAPATAGCHGQVSDTEKVKVKKKS